MELTNELGLRADGRTADQLRNSTLRQNCYSFAEGSSYVEQGNTKVLCAVYGPRESRYRSRVQESKAFINCQFSQALFCGSQQRHRQRGDRVGGRIQQLMEGVLRKLIHTSRYPHCQIDVFFEVLQVDGSVIATCFNAAAIALADAGIEMIGLPSAVTVGMPEGVPCVDLCGREESASVPSATVGMVGQDNIILLHSEAIISSDHLGSILDAAEAGCAKMNGLIEASLMKNVKAGYRRLKVRPRKPDGASY